MIKKEEIEALLAKINIVDLISEYVPLEKSGAGYKGFSPFKQENTPSFMVSPQKNIFKDFSSNIGGDAITFYMKIKNLSYIEAVVELANKYGMILSGVQKSSSIKYKNLYEIMDKACMYFADNLLKSSEGLEYLKNRGYTEEDVKKYRLGFATSSWDGLINFLEKSYKIEDIEALGLAYLDKENGKKFDAFRNRIMFPIFNTRREIIGFGGRDITGDVGQAKYKNSKESPIFKKSDELYGIFDTGKSLKEKKAALLVEGFFDVLSLHKINLTNTVASLGTSLTENQVKLLSKYLKNIVIAYDNDEAGLAAKIRAINLFNKYEFNIKIMGFDNFGKDPDEIINKYGKQKFFDLANKAPDAFEFLYDYYIKKYNMENEEYKYNLVNDLKPYFKSFSSGVQYELTLQKLSKKIGISVEALKSDLHYIKVDNRIQKKEKKEDIAKSESNRKLQLEEAVIYYIMKDKSKYNLFKNFLFTDIVLANIFTKLGQGNLSSIDFSKEENDRILDINLNILNTSNPLENERKVIYLLKEWIITYMSETMKEIYSKYKNKDNVTNQNLSEYNEQLRNISIIKNNTNIDEIISIFNKYLDYEGRNLYV